MACPGLSWALPTAGPEGNDAPGGQLLFSWMSYLVLFCIVCFHFGIFLYSVVENRLSELFSINRFKFQFRICAFVLTGPFYQFIL